LELIQEEEIGDMGAGIHAVPVLFLCFNLIDEQMSRGFLKGSFMVGDYLNAHGRTLELLGC
jgi:hypothetical protein